MLRQSLIEKRYLSRVHSAEKNNPVNYFSRGGQGGEPCREDTFIAKVSRRKERIMGTKIVITSDTLSHSNNKTLKRVQGDKMFTDSSPFGSE